MNEERYYLLHDSAPDGVKLNMLVKLNGACIAMYSAYHNSRTQTYTLYPLRRLNASRHNMRKHTISERMVNFGDQA